MTSTANTAVTTSAYVSLGAGPLRLAMVSGLGVAYQIADAQPAANSPGIPLPLGGADVQTTSLVWVKALFQPATVNSAPLSSVSGAYNVATGDAGVKTASFVGAAQSNPTATGVAVILNVSAVSGASPTLGVQLRFGDGNGNWVNAPGASLSITAAGTYMIICAPGCTSQTGVASLPLPLVWDLNYTIGGSSPSFTIAAVTACYSK